MQAACNMGQLRKTFSSFTKLFTNSFHLKAWKRVASWETFFYDLKMFLLKSFKIPLLFYSLQTSQTCLSFYRHTFRVCWASVQNMPLIEYAIKNKCKQIIRNHNASIYHYAHKHELLFPTWCPIGAPWSIFWTGTVI